MGIEHYVLCDTDKTAFELGKGLGSGMSFDRCTEAVMLVRVVRSWFYLPEGDEMPTTVHEWDQKKHCFFPLPIDAALDESREYLTEVAGELWRWCESKSWTGLRHWQDDLNDDVWIRHATTTESDLEYCRETGHVVYTIQGSRYAE